MTADLPSQFDFDRFRLHERIATALENANRIAMLHAHALGTPSTQLTDLQIDTLRRDIDAELRIDHLDRTKGF